VTHDALVATVVLPNGIGKRVEAPHGGTIEMVAVTPDGTAAVSVDELGGVRLWPALDGSVEPRVVELPRPAQLAIGSDPKGFVIGLIDDAGGLAIQLVDRDGRLVQRAVLPLEPTYHGIAMTRRGLLGWRADQRVVRISSGGAIVDQLATEPGQRVLAIAVATAADRAIAVIEGGTDSLWHRARWLSTDKLAWGGWVKVAGDNVTPAIALAPTRKRFAYLSGEPPNQARVVTIDANGTIGSAPAAFGTAIVMPDDEHVVFAGTSTPTTWLGFVDDVAKATPLRALSSDAIATGGGRLITSSMQELAIASPAKLEYLGYAIVAPTVATPVPGGKLAIAAGDRSALLDRELVSKPFELVPAGTHIDALRWLDDHTWLVEATTLGKTTISLVDADRLARTDIRVDQSTAQLVQYEPSTRVIALSQTETPMVVRYLSGKLQYEAVSALARPPGFQRMLLWPVAPALAGGVELVSAHQTTNLTLRWIRDPRTPDTGPTYTVDGALAAVDATGRAYVLQPDANRVYELALVRDGKRIGALPLTDIHGAIWPDPTGQWLVASGGPEIALLGVDGTRKWTRAIDGVTGVYWLDDATIDVVTAVGIVRLDAKTGEPRAVRCGWSFGLTDQPHLTSTRVESLCTR